MAIKLQIITAFMVECFMVLERLFVTSLMYRKYRDLLGVGGYDANICEWVILVRRGNYSNLMTGISSFDLDLLPYLGYLTT